MHKCCYLVQVCWVKKQVYGRRDGRGMVGHTVAFCAVGLLGENKPMRKAGVSANVRGYET
jgi:hypothetical protein